MLVYAASVRNNMCMGDEVKEDRLIHALDKAGLSDSIKDLDAQLTREFEILKEKTVIFISHRLSSVTACDKIIFMDHGKILEEGTHEYLMNMQGGYYKLFQAQFEEC